MRILLDLQGCQSSSRFRGIGRYALSLAKAIARNAGDHQVWLLLSNAFPEALPQLREELADSVPAERILSFATPGPIAEVNPDNSRRARAAELVREYAIAEIAPDLIHIGSLFEGLGENVVTSIGRLGTGIPTAATMFDLIPFLKQADYLPEAQHKTWYLGKIDSLRRADLLLAISQSARQEAIATLGIPPERIVSIGTAADERFRPTALTPGAESALRARYGLGRKIVMYLAAIEPRKNFEGLIRAYALLPKDLRLSHQLLLVAQGEESARNKLRRLAASLGLASDEVVIVRYATDEDLVALLGLCRLFVFPSLHEGFGLPALEAMACGTPTIGSNTTSVPEVIGRDDALFDPASPKSIASQMQRALADDRFLAELRRHGPRQAKAFSWDNTAKLALRAFEQLHDAERKSRGLRFDPPLYPRLISEIASPALSLSTPDLLQTAEAVAANFSPYSKWIAQFEPHGEPLADTAGTPAISVLVAVAGRQIPALNATLTGLRDQTAATWQCIVCAYGLDESERAALASQIPQGDARIAVVSAAGGTRGKALSTAAEAASGELVLVLDPGDVLPRRALSALAGRFREDPRIDVLYADEDVLDRGIRTAPQLKPEWSPELLTAYNYFGHPTLIRRRLLSDIGSFAPDLDAAAEWDLYLRATQPYMGRVWAPQVRRQTEILCHRHRGSGAQRCGSHDPRSGDFREALKRHWQRQGIEAEVRVQDDGTFHASWDIPNPPLVSVVIPNKDRADLLAVCLDGLLNKTDYPRLEVIVVDNGSSEQATLALYEEKKKQGVAIVPFDEPFNYSRACNRGARVARGELLLFLNNDIEVVSRDWLSEMVRFALRPGVGVVGTKLVYPDGALQHAGVVIGMHLCGLVFRDADQRQWGVYGSPNVSRNWLGIMGACQLIRRDTFERIDGFDERYRLANSDIRLCLDAWRAGYRTAYAPAAMLIHHEGASRGHSNPSEDIVTTAVDIRALGIEEDPYFHPGLSSALAIPTLRSQGDPSVRENLRADTLRLTESWIAPAGLDLGDDRAVTEAAALPREAVLWDPDAPGQIADTWSGARLCIDLLRRRPDLRQRFPNALSEGGDGAFARWLIGEAIARFGLSAAAAQAVAAAFAAPLAQRARQVVLYDEAFRAQQPHCFLPAGRRALIQRLFQAVAAGQLRAEEAWWLLIESAESPEREAVLTWQFTPEWQRRFPDGPTVFGCERFADWLHGHCQDADSALDPRLLSAALPVAEQVRLAYQANAAWQDKHPDALRRREAAAGFLAWLASPAADLPLPQRVWCAGLGAEAVAGALAERGVNLFGHFAYPSGLRTSSESIIKSLHSCGVATACRNVPVDLQADEPTHCDLRDLERFDVSLIHVQPEPFFDVAIERAGIHPRAPACYRIGYWYWELDAIPESWDSAAAQCDEIWTATSFVARGLKERYRIPVHAFLPGYELPEFKLLPRTHFGLPQDAFVFLFAFHMTSIMERKNPTGLIEAFHQALDGRDDALLVVKTSFGSRNPGELAKLMQAAAHPQIRVIDAVFSQDETLSLMAAADAYVSLHRSEGLGLTMAESMLLGKPVIATGYSGNTDFMDRDNALPVEYRLVDLDRDYPPYKAGSRWAEPSVEHAAALMRQVYEDPAFARALGARAQASLRERLGHATCGRPMAARLEEIAAARGARR